MKTISESIRALRHAQGLTQEALAELLGVTPQTVSKWESGTTLPDVSMIVPIASVFSVSTDVIFGVMPDNQEREIQETRRHLEKSNATNEQCAAAWQSIVERYPNNFTARYELAYACHCMKTPESYALAIEHCQRIVDDCADSGIRDKALYLLIHDCEQTGLTEEAVRAASKATGIAASRECLLASIHHAPSARQYKQQLLDFCTQEIPFMLTDQSYDTPADKIAACEAALSVLDAVYYDGHTDKYPGYIYIYVREELACALAAAGRYEDMYAQLDLAFEDCRLQESLPPGSYMYTGNRFLDTIVYEKPAMPEANGMHWLQLAWRLKDCAFDPLRTDDRFCTFEANVRKLVPERMLHF